jgi:hypothetical protein
MAAIHEAGHVVVAMSLRTEFEAVAVFVEGENMLIGLETGKDTVAEVAILQAGDAATSLWMEKTLDSSDDEQTIIALAAQNTELLDLITFEQLKIDTGIIARKLLATNRLAVQKIAKQLARKRYLTYEDCVKIAGRNIIEGNIRDKNNPRPMPSPGPEFIW